MFGRSEKESPTERRQRIDKRHQIKQGCQESGIGTHLDNAEDWDEQQEIITKAETEDKEELIEGRKSKIGRPEDEETKN